MKRFHKTIVKNNQCFVAGCAQCIEATAILPG